MALIQIPVSSTPSESFALTIDQVTYRAGFNWAEKNLAWYMDLYQVSGEPVFLGHKVMYNSSIFEKYSYIDPSPQGTLILLDTTNTRLTPDYNSISTTDRLYYLS